ncbi:hypothetical protein SNEBB_010477, partial [Seison nebaliae]
MKPFQICFFCCFLILVGCSNGKNSEKKGRREIPLLDDDFVTNEDINDDLSNDNASPQEEAVMVEGGKRKIIPVDEVTAKVPSYSISETELKVHLLKLLGDLYHKDSPQKKDVVEKHDAKVNDNKGLNFNPADLPEYVSEDENFFDNEDVPKCQAHGDIDNKDVPKCQPQGDIDLGLEFEKRFCSRKKDTNLLPIHRPNAKAVEGNKLCPVCEQYHLPIHQCWQAYQRKILLQIQDTHYTRVEYDRKKFFAEQLAIYMEEDQHLNQVLEEVANVGEGNVKRVIDDPMVIREFFNHIPKSPHPSRHKARIHSRFILDLRSKIESLSGVEPFLPLSTRNTVIHLKVTVSRWMALNEMEVMRFLRIKDKSLPCRYKPPIQINNVFMQTMTPLAKNNGFLFMPPPLTERYVASFRMLKHATRESRERFYNLYSWVTHTRLWGTYLFHKYFFFDGEKDYDDKYHLPTMLTSLANMHGGNSVLRFTLYLMSRYFAGEAFTQHPEREMSENYDIFYVTPFECREIVADDINPDITPMDYYYVAVSQTPRNLGNILASREFIFLLRSVERYLHRIDLYIEESIDRIERAGRKVNNHVRSIIIRNPAFLAFIEFYFDPESAKEVRNLQRQYEIAMERARRDGKKERQDYSSSDSEEDSTSEDK